jgi:integrase
MSLHTCFVFFSSPDLKVFTHGLFGELFESCRQSKDTSAMKLADVVKDFALHSRADGTVVNYVRSFSRWQKFAEGKGYTVFPANHLDLAIFIGHVAQESQSVSVLQSMSAGITWVHEIVGLPSPMHNTFLKNILEGVKRRFSRPINRKEPVSPDSLTALCTKHQYNSDLLVVRDITMALLLFAGFLRFGELAALCVRDV